MITDIQLQNFRLFANEAFDFSDGVNIIVGANASGKSSIIEALLLEARGNSYRTSNSADMVQFNKPWARIDVHTPGGQRTVKLEASNGVARKSFEIDGQKLSRLSINKSIPAVLFEPRHLQLLTTKPDLRREYLDDLLEQTTPGYQKLRRDYRRALGQRNALLKTGLIKNPEQIFAWNIRLSDLGGQIALHRHKLIETIDSKLSELYSEIANTKVNISVSYDSKSSVDSYSNQMLRRLEQNKDIDVIRGYTTVGPHRDDLKVVMNDHIMQDTASRGESRTVLLSFKIIELGLIEEVLDKKPILLLDDVFSELDGARRSALTKFLNKYQTFITTTDADLVVKNFTQKSNIIPI